MHSMVVSYMTKTSSIGLRHHASLPCGLPVDGISNVFNGINAEHLQQSSNGPCQSIIAHPLQKRSIRTHLG